MTLPKITFGSMLESEEEISDGFFSWFKCFDETASTIMSLSIVFDSLYLTFTSYMGMGKYIPTLKKL